MGILSSEPTEQEIREEQDTRQEHQMNLQAGQTGGEPMDKTYIQETLGYDASQGTIDLLSNLLDRDFMLGNATEAEQHEYRWLARVKRLEIEAMHPNEDSVFQGELRAVAFDDRSQNLTSLSEQDLSQIQSFIMVAIRRAGRGRDGWQQEMYNKTITASEKREVGEDDDGGFL